MGDKERLGHIIDYAALIEKALIDVTEERFYEDFILNAAVLKWVEVIGEASYKITKTYKAAHTDIEWKRIEGMRHIAVHDYFGIDLPRIWQVAKNNVPGLKEKVSKLYNEFED